MPKEYTGYEIKEAIAKWVVRRDIANKAFTSSIWAFDNDDKPQPGSAFDAYKNAEIAIAKLECLQDVFNLNVRLEVQGTQTTLAECVKLRGSAQRMSEMWRNATQEVEHIYSRTIRVRKQDDVYAKKQVSRGDGVAEVEKATNYLSAIKAAIAAGNARKIQVNDEQLIAFLDK